jgi:hypothetical protein
MTGKEIVTDAKQSFTIDTGKGMRGKESVIY